MKMSDFDYKGFYDKVGFENGWNFSRLNCYVEGKSWDFYEEVRKKCSKTDKVLDIGCGGGERVLQLADDVLLLVGIDRSAGMVTTANRNLSESVMTNVKFLQMEADRLVFPNGFFHLISCRQAPSDAVEAARVLNDGGVFITQQVSEHDKLNLKEAFGRGQCLEVRDGTMKERYIHELETAGFQVLQVREYNASEYYGSIEDLIFLLKYTPIIPDFGRDERDFKLLDDFVKKNMTDKGILTNSKRFMITATKGKHLSLENGSRRIQCQNR